MELTDDVKINTVYANKNFIEIVVIYWQHKKKKDIIEVANLFVCIHKGGDSL